MYLSTRYEFSKHSTTFHCDKSVLLLDHKCALIDDVDNALLSETDYIFFT